MKMKPAKRSAKSIAKNRPEKAAKLTEHLGQGGGQGGTKKPSARKKKLRHPNHVNAIMAMRKKNGKKV